MRLCFSLIRMMAAIAQSAPEAKDRMRAFVEGRAAKVQKA